MKLNINTDEAVKFTNKLEKLHKSALPVAIREALNDAVIDVKQNTMPTKAIETFVNRSKNFFKANSKYEKAKGFNIHTMTATVGFFENKLVEQSTNYAVKDLEEQEGGGVINMKTFIPTVYARTGNTKRGLVRPNFRLKSIRRKGLLDVSKMYTQVAGNERQKYMIAAKRVGIGGFIMYKRFIWKINKVDVFGGNNKRSRIERTPLYHVSKGRNIRVKTTNFMKLASLKTNNKMEGYYIGQAQKQINRLVGR